MKPFLQFSRLFSCVTAVGLAVGCSKPAPPAAKPAPPSTPAPVARETPPDRSSLGFERAPTITHWPAPDSPAKERLAWNLETLVEAYDQVGTKDPRWDAAARDVLRAFAELRSGGGEEVSSRLPGLARAAAEAGCTDPLVAYLVLRFTRAPFESADESLATDYRRVAAELARSKYTPVRKYYVAVRAAQAWKSAHRSDPESVHVYGPLREQAFGFLGQTLQLPDIPAEEALDAVADFYNIIWSNTVEQDQFLPTLIEGMSKRWPENGRALLLRGRAQVRLAWNRRGNGYASTVTEEGWKGFNKHLATAERNLAESWKQDPASAWAAVEMMKVQLGKGADHARMKLWFNRAMQADPACYDAAHSMAWYLQPKWHGSAEEAIAFGRQCVASKVWKGRVPLVLVEAHQMLANDNATGLKEKYWPRPGVWSDVKASYDRFLELNPESTWALQELAAYAHKCRQFGAFLDLLPRFGELNDANFGGREAFERMVAEAARETGRVPSWPAGAEPAKR